MGCGASGDKDVPAAHERPKPKRINAKQESKVTLTCLDITGAAVAVDPPASSADAGVRIRVESCCHRRRAVLPPSLVTAELTERKNVLLAQLLRGGRQLVRRPPAGSITYIKFCMPYTTEAALVGVPERDAKDLQEPDMRRALTVFLKNTRRFVVSNIHVTCVAGTSQAVRCVRVSPTDQFILYSDGTEGPTEVCDTSRGMIVAYLQNRKASCVLSATNAAFSWGEVPHLVTVHPLNRIILWEADSFKVLRLIRHTDRKQHVVVTRAIFSPDGRMLAITAELSTTGALLGGTTGLLIVKNSRTRRVVVQRHYDSPISSLLYVSDSSLLVVGMEDGVIESVVMPSRAHVTLSLCHHDSAVIGLARTRDDKLISCDMNRLSCWELKSSYHLRLLWSRPANVQGTAASERTRYTCCSSAPGGLVMAALDNATVEFINADGSEFMILPTRHRVTAMDMGRNAAAMGDDQGNVYSLAFS